MTSQRTISDLAVYLADEDSTLTRLDPESGQVLGRELDPGDATYGDVSAILTWTPKGRSGEWTLNYIVNPEDPDELDVDDYRFGGISSDDWREAVKEALDYMTR